MADAKCHPSWVQVGPNTYQQPYGFQEVLYSAITVPVGSPGLFLIGTSVSFTYKPALSSQTTRPDLVSLLRNAWLQLRQQYPTLATEILPDGKTYVSPSSRADLEAWLNSTFVVVPGTTYTEQWKKLIKTKQITMYYFPEERQLFMQGEHHILDGRGCMNFWDRFFQGLASPASEDVLWRTDGTEVPLLGPRSDDLLNTTETTSGRGEARALEILAPLFNMKAPISIPIQHPLPPCSTRNGVVEVKLSLNTTKFIIAACKAQRLSVTGAWHTGVALATQAVQAQRSWVPGTQVGNQFAAFGNFDLRRYFPGSSIPDAYALSNHHGVLPYVVSLEGKSFAAIARELGVFYQQDLPAQDPEIWSALGPMIKQMVPEFTQPQLEETTPALSSLGVVDSFIRSSYPRADGKGTWNVDNVWFGDTVTGPWMECFMWAWQGRLSLNVCYNPAYYTNTEVEAFSQLVADKMLEGLGVTGVSGKL